MYKVERPIASFPATERAAGLLLVSVPKHHDFLYRSGDLASVFCVVVEERMRPCHRLSPVAFCPLNHQWKYSAIAGVGVEIWWKAPAFLVARAATYSRCKDTAVGLRSTNDSKKSPTIVTYVTLLRWFRESTALIETNPY